MRPETHGTSEHGNIVQAALILSLLAIFLTWVLRENIFQRFADYESGFHEAVLNLANNNLGFVEFDGTGNLTTSDDVFDSLGQVSLFLVQTTKANGARSALFFNTLNNFDEPTWEVFGCVDDQLHVIDSTICNSEMESQLPSLTSGSLVAEKRQYRLVVQAWYPSWSEPLSGDIPLRPRKIGTDEVDPGAPPAGPSSSPAPSANPSGSVGH